MKRITILSIAFTVVAIVLCTIACTWPDATLTLTPSPNEPALKITLDGETVHYCMEIEDDGCTVILKGCCKCRPLPITVYASKEVECEDCTETITLTRDIDFDTIKIEEY